MFKKIIAILILQREPILTSRVVLLKNSETELWDVFADLLNMFFYLLFCSSITNFMALSREQSQSPEVNHCVLINFQLEFHQEPHNKGISITQCYALHLYQFLTQRWLGTSCGKEQCFPECWPASSVVSIKKCWWETNY